jgi:hypothetical protein
MTNVSISTPDVSAPDLTDIYLIPHTNMPENMEAAIQRILELECRLEDLARGFEIADACGMYQMMHSFVEQANQALETKMIMLHESSEFKIRRVVNDVNDHTDTGAYQHQP